MTTAQTSIWHDVPTLEVANAFTAGNLVGHLGIEFVEAGPDHLTARMPVDERTFQPMGLLHGGASVALAETLASFAATFAVDHEQASCVGMEINANHLRSVTSGWVIGRATPIALGRTQVWEIRISDEQGSLVCISRCTLAVVPRRA